MLRIRPLLVLAAALLSQVPVAAHHSYAMFDQTRSATVKGTVRALELDQSTRLGVD